ncbi:unnamed protein product [Heterotrigona itama]|uniref:RIIa domain-containing protein n=1 Tax=Heterotrigona itama TaxID=395501 RepID=A0A6V7H1X8_9HYME|nr:unnamed protein product [Heterotrigona itama]
MSRTDCTAVPRVPRGLPPAVRGLAREILRQRPRHVYAFAARHFARLVKLRDDEPPPRQLPDKRDDDDEKKENDYRVRVSGDIEKTYAAERNERSNGKRTERVVARRRRPSPRFSTKDPFVRSSSAGDATRAKRVESRALAENLETFYAVAAAASRDPTDSRRNERNSTRRKSADRIERRDHRPRTDGRNFIEDDEWKSLLVEDRREGQEKSRETLADAKRRVDEVAEALPSNDATLLDRSRTNENEPEVGTVSVVLPSVVGRPRSSGKCTGSNDVRERCEYESNEEEEEEEEEDAAGNDNFTLPPISSDGSKSTTRASNFIELPSLSNDVDAARHPDQRQRGMHRRHRSERSTTSSTSRTRERTRSAKASFRLERTTVQLANSDYDRLRATAENESDGQRDSRDDVNARDIVSPETACPRPCKSVDGRRVDETQIPRQPGIVRRPRSGSSSPAEEAAEIPLRDETWKDSSSVTPDSIRLESEKRNETRERRRPNELERKLIEIETMERSVENALLSSRTVADDFDGRPEENSTERSTVEFPARIVEPDRAPNERDVSRRVRDERTKKNSDKSRSATSDENNADANDDRVDEIDSAEGETSKIRKRSNFHDSDDSKTSFVDEDDDGDDGRGRARYVAEIVGRSQPAGGIDVSCYVLAEGSPCEIPETVITVVIPDKLVDRSDDNVVRQDRNSPFGEYIAPETGIAAPCSSTVDARFLRDVVKDAADRASARRRDLANIREEEENQGRPFSKILRRGTAVDCEANSTSFDRRDDRRRANAVSSPVLSDVVSGHPSRVAKNGNSTSDPVSPSFERVGPTTNVPELNLDSLRDATISSTIGETESKNLLSDDVVVSSEDENISLSSFASSDNERKLNDPSNDPTFESFENHRARLLGEPVTETTETGNRTNDDEKESRRVEEEEIARELIRNFTIDHDETVESNDSTTSSSSPEPRANGLDTESSRAENFVVQFHPSVRPSASKVPIGEESSRREKLDDDDDDDDDDTRAERKEDERTSEEQGRRESGQPERETTENEASIFPLLLRAPTDDRSKDVESSLTNFRFYRFGFAVLGTACDEMEETALSEKERKKGPIARDRRHTGEFHDSLPLPLVETTSENIMLVCRSSKPALRTTDDCELAFPANPCSEMIQPGCTGIFNVPSPRCRSDELSPTIVDIFENFHLLVNASSNWNRLSSNASPCVVRVGRAPRQVPTTDEAGSTPIYQRRTSFNSDPDDLREPLALDDAPRPVVIEEISNSDRGGGERSTSLPEADANFPTEIVRPRSPERFCPSDNVEDEDEGTTSVRETTNQFDVDDDNLPADVDIGSATLPPNVENLEEEATNDE